MHVPSSLKCLLKVDARIPGHNRYNCDPGTGILTMVAFRCEAIPSQKDNVTQNAMYLVCKRQSDHYFKSEI